MPVIPVIQIGRLSNQPTMKEPLNMAIPKPTALHVGTRHDEARQAVLPPARLTTDDGRVIEVAAWTVKTPADGEDILVTIEGRVRMDSVNQKPPASVPTQFPLYMCGEFPPRDTRLDQLAKEYHDTCESFDKTVCAARGGGIPTTPHEQARVSRHASELIHELAHREGVPLQELREAIRERIRQQRRR